MHRVRRVRVLIYEGTPQFVEQSLGPQRAVKDFAAFPQGMIIEVMDQGQMQLTIGRAPVDDLITEAMRAADHLDGTDRTLHPAEIARRLRELCSKLKQSEPVFRQ